MLERGTYWYHGEEYVLGGIKPYEKEFVNRLGDAFQFYMEQTFPKAFADGWSVFAVEQDFEYEFAPGVIVEGTIDLIMQKGNIFTVWDHKTVSNVSTALQFLKLDTQMFAYEIMANDIIKKLHPGAQQVEMLYNIIRRDRPPGFGSRELRRNKDGSVSKQNASQDPADYLRQHRFHHNKVELHHASREFFNLVTEIEARLANDTDAEDQFSTRTPIKSGGEACLTSCSYFERCAAEMVGHRSPTFVPAQVEGDTD
jgi:hypothetical protein